MIKYWDYLREYKELKREIINSVNKVFESGTLLFGRELKKFEKNFCKFNNSKYGLGVGSGTDALFIALKVLDVGVGDEVITVSNTAIPTVAAIKNTGAEVMFVDIGKDFLINVKKIKHAISSKTKAIIPVHLFGQTCDMNEILLISKKYNLKIIEDCAQACGALYKGRKAGSMGDIGCYSFYPTKILGAYGDGGFLTTNNKRLYEKMHRFRFYGIDTLKKNKKWNNKYYSIDHGTNSRLNEIQASILNLKLKYINSYIRKRRFIAQKYFKGLKGPDVKMPIINKENFHVFHIFAVSHPKRELILKKMRSKNINLVIHYPYPIHTMKAYNNFTYDYSNRLIETEKKAKTIFSLPIYPSIKNYEIENIIQNINKIVSKI
jgi:dTDP-4-amino-4,6-dideoxygalactose transaminase